MGVDFVGGGASTTPLVIGLITTKEDDFQDVH